MKVAVKGRRIVYIKDGRVSGELRFSETHPNETNEKEVYRHREEELLNFLQKRGY